MPDPAETRPRGVCCHLHRLQTIKVFLVIMIVSVIVLGILTGGFNVGKLRIRLQSVGIGSNNSYPLLDTLQSSSYTSTNGSLMADQSTDNDVTNDVRNLRILCLILTMEKDLHTKADAVNKTWAKRCHRHYYVMYSKLKGHDILNVDLPDIRKLLIAKMKRAFRYVYDNHLNDFDYILKADDDTYVIIENLQLLVSNYPADEPGYLGFHFNKFVKSGYMSGGAGYVITNRGLRHLIERGYNKNLCPVIKRPEDKENSEDIETGRCLQYAGVPVLSSLDAEGRDTFHPYTLHKHLFNGVPRYVFSWAKNKVGKGKECCSRFSISFHYMTPDSILYTDHLLYDTTVFGVTGRTGRHKDIFRIGQVV